MRATSIGHAGLLVETRQATIACDPWFEPQFFGSWFVFPRNDQLPRALMDAIEHPDYLYISHLHADHLDESFLREHMDKRATVLLPGFPSEEMERTLRAIGFTEFVHTKHGQPVELRDGLRVTIHVETSISDGPGGDSALLVDDGETRLLDMNDCRVHDVAALLDDGPVDLHWLQFSGAIWYPMVYDMPEDDKREAARLKVDAQFTRAIRYVQAIGARGVVPSAGPPCFLDPDLFGVNLIDGDEISIFPDQREFLRRLAAEGIHTGRLTIPGTCWDIGPETITVTHPMPDEEVARIFTEKRAYLERYQADWAPWLVAHRASWHPARPGLTERLRAWWEPLLVKAPALRRAVGAAALFRCGDEQILVDFPAGTVRAWDGEALFAFSFDIPRQLVETVVDRRAVDWSNALFLSCRFRAWRAGEFNEYLYNFLKSLSPERIERTEAEALAKRQLPLEVEEIELGDYVVERWCPHRKADLSVFGEVCDGVLTCHLHGWQFDLETGACLTATDRELRVRPAPTRPTPSA
jgi:UDP-MurNAc hydroxylase